MSFFSFCCGEGEEEAKFGAVADPSEYDWDDQESSEINVYKKRIAQREGNVGLLNKAKKIRGTIFAKPVDLKECDDFQPPIFSKSEAQCKFLQDTLKDSFVFLDLDEAEGRMFIQAMEQEQIDKKGTRIIQQGDVGDFFYIVESGTVAFLDGDKQVGTSGSGSYFGELALLYDCARAVSCDTASGHVALWKVDQYTFRHLLVRHAHRHYQKMADLMRKISIFKDLDDSTLARFTNAMTPVHWEQGDRIVQKGSEGTVFYIIQEGKVKIHDIGLGDSQFEDQMLGPGGWFGERALLTGEPRAANATAMTPVTTMAMDRETFETSIGALQGLLEREMRKQFLKGLPIFAQSSGVTDPEFDRLADQMQEVCYRKGDKLAEAGKPYEQNLWIIRHGQLLVYSEKTEKIWNLKSGDHFGDKSIRGDPDHISSHNAVCEENVTTWVLSRKAIESVIGDIDRLAQSISPFSKSRQAKPIRLGDLKKRRVLGQGAFGRVWLVSHNLEADTGYALKEIGKQKLLDSGQDKSVLREKELLYVLRHPFILHLVSSFQDEHNLYLLLPLIPGGELFSLLQKQKQRHAGLPNKKASFYAACVVEGLGHFHQRRIAYRDLKLENILIDEEGYCKIVDLGFAKVIADKTYTLVGTPEYLAPEIIMSKGHDQAADYWSYGVLVYELLAGQSPFFKPGSKQIDMFKRIVLVKYDIPSFVKELARDLIQNLLVRQQSQRLGNLANGYLDIKNHGWFEDSKIDFRQVLKKKVQAPWKPQVKDPFDSSNFDDFSSAEREVAHGRRLTKAEQELFKGF